MQLRPIFLERLGLEPNEYEHAKPLLTAAWFDNNKKRIKDLGVLAKKMYGLFATHQHREMALAASPVQAWVRLEKKISGYLLLLHTLSKKDFAKGEQNFEASAEAGSLAWVLGSVLRLAEYHDKDFEAQLKDLTKTSGFESVVKSRMVVEDQLIIRPQVTEAASRFLTTFERQHRLSELKLKLYANTFTNPERDEMYKLDAVPLLVVFGKKELFSLPPPES